MKKLQHDPQHRFEIMKGFVDLCQKRQRQINSDELYSSSEITRQDIRNEFGTFENFKIEVFTNFRRELSFFFTELDFGLEQQDNFIHKYNRSKSKNIIVFTAVPNERVHEGFLHTLRHIAKDNKAQLICLVTDKRNILRLDPVLKSNDIQVLVTDMTVNNNLAIYGSLEVSSTAANVPKNIGRYSSPDGSVITPSTKAIFHSIPNAGHHPRCVIGTGSITQGDLYRSNLSGRKAQLSHFISASLVLVKNEQIFIHRNLTSFKDGACVNEGILYKPNGVKRKLDKTEMSHVWGDIHAVEANPEYVKVLEQIQKDIPCSSVVLHDLHTQVNSHHISNKVVTRAKIAKTGLLNIEEELNITRAFVDKQALNFDKVHVVDSNHNRHLSQYLDKGNIESDNFKTASILSLAMYYGVDPLQFANQHYESFLNFLEAYMNSIQNRTELSFKISSKSKCANVCYLEAGEKLNVRNFNLAWHGDQAGNGCKGSPDALRYALASESANSYGTVTGHSHTPGYINNAYVVGTTTYLPFQDKAPVYCKGSISSWANASVIVYAPKGYEVATAQLFVCVNKTWK